MEQVSKENICRVRGMNPGLPDRYATSNIVAVFFILLFLFSIKLRNLFDNNEKNCFIFVLLFISSLIATIQSHDSTINICSNKPLLSLLLTNYPSLYCRDCFVDNEERYMTYSNSRNSRVFKTSHRYF